MQDIPYKDIDYCKYGMPYRKRTRLWNNINCWEPRPLCNNDCDAMRGNKHKETAQRAAKTGKNDRRRFTQSELYRVPSELIDEIMQCIKDETFNVNA